MADGVNLNEGAGPKKVATDDVSGTHYQMIKLVSGYDQDTAVVPATATRGLWVDTKSSVVRLQATPVISNGAVYATGDCLGPIQTVAGAAINNGDPGKLLAVTILDKTQAQRSAIDLYFWDRAVTTAADNALFTISDADMVFCLGGIAIATGDYNTAWPGTPTNNIATKILATPLPFVLSGSTNLYMQAIVRGTPTYTSTSDIVISLLIERG